MRIAAPTQWYTRRDTDFVSVEDGPVLKVTGIAHHGKSFKVDTARILYHLTSARWVAHVTLVGNVLKGDGTTGRQRLHNEYVDMESGETPEYVRSLAAHFAPLTPVPVSTAKDFTYRAA